jgi:hypothetical protein
MCHAELQHKQLKTKSLMEKVRAGANLCQNRDSEVLTVSELSRFFF